MEDSCSQVECVCFDRAQRLRTMTDAVLFCTSSLRSGQNDIDGVCSGTIAPSCRRPECSSYADSSAATRHKPICARTGSTCHQVDAGNVPRFISTSVKLGLLLSALVLLLQVPGASAGTHVTKVSPRNRPLTGGQSITIAGFEFGALDAHQAARVGGTAATATVWRSATELVAVVAPGAQPIPGAQIFDVVGMPHHCINGRGILFQIVQIFVREQARVTGRMS